MVSSVENKIGQECQEWISALRTDRSALAAQREHLQALISEAKVSHDKLPAVDHFENQFEIQLTNINHLKHAMKEHLHVLETTPPEHLSAPHLTIHESLSDQYQILLGSISQLRQEFNDFLDSIK